MYSDISLVSLMNFGMIAIYFYLVLPVRWLKYDGVMCCSISSSHSCLMATKSSKKTLDSHDIFILGMKKSARSSMIRSVRMLHLSKRRRKILKGHVIHLFDVMAYGVNRQKTWKASSFYQNVWNLNLWFLDFHLEITFHVYKRPIDY